MKKKYSATSKDKKDWLVFTKHLENVYNKDDALEKESIKISKIHRLDLHGYSLDQANKKVKKFIIESFESKYKKLLIITGKGIRSKIYDNPYASQKMSILKYSVPEFVKNDKDLSDKIKKISKANIKDGGEGAFYIFLK